MSTLTDSQIDELWMTSIPPGQTGAEWRRKFVRSIAAALEQQAAHDLGAKGAEATEHERLLFEAWMRGHCWALGAEWDGECYRGIGEHDGAFCPIAMQTRRIWAAWRDCAALHSGRSKDDDFDGDEDRGHRDAERLDWMIEQRAYVVSDPTICDGYWINWPRPDGTTWTQAGEYNTPREAIDAAMMAGENR